MRFCHQKTFLTRMRLFTSSLKISSVTNMFLVTKPVAKTFIIDSLETFLVELPAKFPFIYNY